MRSRFCFRRLPLGYLAMTLAIGLVSGKTRGEQEGPVAPLPPPPAATAAPAQLQPKAAAAPATNQPAKPPTSPAAKPATPPTDNTAARQQPPPNMIALAEPMESLAAIPAMLGDLPMVTERLSFGIGSNPTQSISLPLAAAAGRTKIAEDNSPWTGDRAFLLLNCYTNSLNVTNTSGAAGLNTDRFLFGVEKSFLDHTWSVEIRMPLATQVDYTAPGLEMDGGQVGNLQVNVKRLVYESRCTAICIGAGIDMPTGSDVAGFVPLTTYTIHNDAVHVMPFVGVLRRPNDCWFWQAFLQLDVPTNGDRVELSQRNSTNNIAAQGLLNEQTLLYADISAGYWLCRKDCGLLTGLAAIAEIHNTTALGGNTVSAGTPVPVSFGPQADGIDILDFTVGLHADLRYCTALRVGAAFPLTNSNNRAFDSELQVQLERRF